MPRRFPIFQFPNRPLIVAGLAGAVTRLIDRQYSPGGRRYLPVTRLISHLALLIWALEEVASGANWFRRLLGLGGGGYALGQLRGMAAERKRSVSSGALAAERKRSTGCSSELA